jgi:hypothetical protein
MPAAVFGQHQRRRAPAALDGAEGWVRDSRAWLALGKEKGRKKGAGAIADFTGHLAVTMVVASMLASRRGGERVDASVRGLGGGRGGVWRGVGEGAVFIGRGRGSGRGRRWPWPMAERGGGVGQWMAGC